MLVLVKCENVVSSAGKMSDFCDVINVDWGGGCVDLATEAKDAFILLRGC